MEDTDKQHLFIISEASSSHRSPIFHGTFELSLMKAYFINKKIDQI